FYGAMADGYSVDAALTEARRAIFAQGRGVEWGTPVLYMRAPDAYIFDVTPIVQQVSTQQDPDTISATASLKDEPVVKTPTSAIVPSTQPTPLKFGRWMAIGMTIIAMLFVTIAFVFNLLSNSGTTSITRSTVVSSAAVVSSTATVVVSQTPPINAPTLESTATSNPISVIAAIPTNKPTIVLIPTEVPTSVP